MNKWDICGPRKMFLSDDCGVGFLLTWNFLSCVLRKKLNYVGRGRNEVWRISWNNISFILICVPRLILSRRVVSNERDISPFYLSKLRALFLFLYFILFYNFILYRAKYHALLIPNGLVGFNLIIGLNLVMKKKI